MKKEIKSTKTIKEFKEYEEIHNKKASDIIIEHLLRLNIDLTLTNFGYDYTLKLPEQTYLITKDYKGDFIMYIDTEDISLYGLKLNKSSYKPVEKGDKYYSVYGFGIEEHYNKYNWCSISVTELLETLRLYVDFRHNYKKHFSEYCFINK